MLTWIPILRMVTIFEVWETVKFYFVTLRHMVIILSIWSTVFRIRLIANTNSAINTPLHVSFVDEFNEWLFHVFIRCFIRCSCVHPLTNDFFMCSSVNLCVVYVFIMFMRVYSCFYEWIWNVNVTCIVQCIRSGSLIFQSQKNT